MWIKRPFPEVDAELGLSDAVEFDIEFDTAFVHAGDVRASGAWTGGDLIEACASGAEDRLRMFVVHGDLAVAGTLDLDEGADGCIGLLVTGNLAADAVAVDATILYVLGDARVTRRIDFTTTDGTLVIAGRTDCPLVLHADGNLDVDATGEVRSIRG